jgi:hypothetical protein
MGYPGGIFPLVLITHGVGVLVSFEEELHCCQ